MYTVRFMLAHDGSFKTTKVETFASGKEVLAAVKAYAEPMGYTNIKEVENDESGIPEVDGYRITGKTPGGRSGRNIAFVDFEPDDTL